jgi:hypothetical protein
MIMRSFAGLCNPRLQLRLALAGIACAAFAVSLLLAVASVSLPRPAVHIAPKAVEIPIAAAPQRAVASPRTASAGAEGHNSAPLWSLLTPWTLSVDAIAVVGFIVMARMWRR